MEKIYSLVVTGVTKLIELVPIWLNSSAERRAQILAKAEALVSGLDEIFDAADVKDNAATQAARDAIRDALAKQNAQPKGEMLATKVSEEG